MRRKKTEDEAVLTPDPTAASRQRLTPADIQQAEFRLSMRGYNEREVDELLDRLTEDWGAVLEENKRLRDPSGPVATATPSDTSVADAKREADAIISRARHEAAEIVRNASPASPAAAPSDAAEAAAVASFLNKERDFLQSLGRLVQGHAESVKSMAFNAKAAESKPAAGSAPSPQPAPKAEASAQAPKPAAPAPAAAPASRASRPAEPPAPQNPPRTTAPPTQPVVKIDAGEEAPAPASAPQARAAQPTSETQKAQPAPSRPAQASSSPAPAKQPAAIRIPEGSAPAPERAAAPAGASQGPEHRGDQTQNREEELSLRELFWGDE
ncbi:MAG: DivIVA domain-containing protein [Actinomycetota bacterium]